MSLSRVDWPRRMLKKTVTFEVLESTRADVFADFCGVYKECFPLEDEREPPEAFGALFALNSNLDVQQKYGPYREVVLMIRAWPGGPVIGGHIFGITTSESHHRAGYSSSVQGIYTFLRQAFRGLVPMSAFFAQMREWAGRIFPPLESTAHPPPIFFEVNNPSRMTAEQIALDTESSGVSPQRRYQLWRRTGGFALDFPYVQPRLNAGAAPVRYLDLFCYAGTHAVPSALLRAHLRAFFLVSVLKGDETQDEDVIADLEQYCESRKEIGQRL